MNIYDELLEKIKQLEAELKEEIERRNKQFFYEIRKRKVIFEKNVLRRHKKMALGLWKYIKHTRPRHIIGIPIIYSMIFPVIFLDLMVTFYQYAFFPLFKLKQVTRKDYIIIDRRFLGYLNPIEKLNCIYCGYFNGVIAYVREIAGRTEYRFCPIKHATTADSFHSHYTKFVDYGDAENALARFDEIDRIYKEKKLLDPNDPEQAKRINPQKGASPQSS